MPSSFSDTAQAQDHPSLYSLDKRMALLEMSFENLSNQMERMNGHLAWIVRGMFGAIAGAIIKFALEGGFNR